MVWTCFGFLDQCHVGNAYFRSSTDGLCLNDADQERYDGLTPFRIVFCVIRERSLTHPHRHVTGWRDGIFMWSVPMPDSWDHMELTYDMGMDGVWEFKFQDSDTSEVLCSKMIGLNIDAVFEEEIPEEDVGEDVIDYDKIMNDMIEVENDLMGKIKYIDLFNDYDRTDNKNEVISEITTESDKTQGLIGSVHASVNSGLVDTISFTRTIGLAIGNSINGVSDQISALGFPTIDSIKETFISTASEIADRILERIWDEIERRYEK